MSEYKHTVSKQTQGGFSSSPVQTVANAGSPSLDDQLKVKDVVTYGAAFMYGKKLLSNVVKAQVGQMGIPEIERALEDVQKLSTYILLSSINPALGGLAIGSDIVVGGIERTVNIHNTNMTNERLIQERGTRRKMNAGGFYA